MNRRWYMIDIYNRLFHHLGVTKIQPLTDRPDLLWELEGNQKKLSPASIPIFIPSFFMTLAGFYDTCWILCWSVFSRRLSLVANFEPSL